MDTVDIIVPVYNVQKYLPQCLDSISAQTYPYWRAIMVDDGSTDSSGAICEEYASNDPRFVAVHKENGGAASAKNAGLDRVTAPFLTFIDSDDYVEPTWLERTVGILLSKEADVVEFRFDKVFRNHAEPSECFTHDSQEYTAEQYLREYLRIWTSSLFCNKVMRAGLADSIRFKRERRCIDDEFFTYKVMSSAKKIVRINDVLYHYRQRASSAVMSENNRLQITNDALDILVERYEWICERFPGLRRTFLQHDVQILFYFADFLYDAKSAEKFKRISRYYLRQCVLYPTDPRIMLAALRLQGISQKRLLAPKVVEAKKQDLTLYFE